MALLSKFTTSEMSYIALRKECLDAIRQWPGCETVSGIQLVRQNNGHFSVRISSIGRHWLIAAGMILRQGAHCDLDREF
jgi:hypothetical protein